MPRFLVKLKDVYFEWSTIVDAPVSYAMTLEELKAWHTEEYGRSADHEFTERMARVEQYGTSAQVPQTPEQLIGFNRAGANEACLTLDEIYQKVTVTP